MSKLDLNTIEGQYSAGLYCAKNYFSKSRIVEGRCDRLNTRALIYRIYSDMGYRLEKEKQKLDDSWYKGINEGKRIR